MAVLLDETEVFDRPSARFGAVSPIAHGLTVATREELPWLVVLRGTQIRLYPARPDIGVGRKGQAETYTELDLALLSEEEAAYLTLLFAPSALDPGGTAGQILAASENFAVGLGERLRERIYDDVVPGLALAVAARMRPQSDADLTEAYHRTLLDPVPAAVPRLRGRPRAASLWPQPPVRQARHQDAGPRLRRRPGPGLRRARDQFVGRHAHCLGRSRRRQQPAGTCPPTTAACSPVTRASNPSGAALADLRLADAEFGPVLRALLVDMGEDGTQGPVDFRSLSVREFGTIYEGLLESDLSVSQTDLTVDANGSYLPAGPGERGRRPAGRSTSTTSPGSARPPARTSPSNSRSSICSTPRWNPPSTRTWRGSATLLGRGDEAGAAEAFFDLRVADLAMGSAHFLVAAIDRIEAKFTAFLTEHQIPAVSDELTRLAQAARAALGEHADNVEIETGALLRRQIARRCIYGLDLNLMAVELARLGIWIHTFVPGLPMSALDHNLVVGNSLTGIGTIDEVLDVLEPQRSPARTASSRTRSRPRWTRRGCG